MISFRSDTQYAVSVPVRPRYNRDEIVPDTDGKTKDLSDDIMRVTVCCQVLLENPFRAERENKLGKVLIVYQQQVFVRKLMDQS
mmetsp:Transcript_3957/g.4407  ORF Transcript_3957/g.4407 Transcript_3957/m.4407 type:complete len:84 (+) Transcript_3957:817-1068(+)